MSPAEDMIPDAPDDDDEWGSTRIKPESVGRPRRGMSRAEIARWTDAMIASGERMDFSGLTRPTADKHSTGGVGDKITLPLAPLVAVFVSRDTASEVSVSVSEAPIFVVFAR